MPQPSTGIVMTSYPWLIFRFSVRLPALAPARGEEQEQEKEQPSTVPAARVPGELKPPPARLRVLVVDDNLDAAELLGHLLGAEGHEVKVVHDAASALEVAPQFLPDVALLDIGLPVMNGYELARRLRRRLGSAPCRLIAVTGYGQERDRARSRRAGFDVHLVKPMDPQALLALLGPVPRKA